MKDPFHPNMAPYFVKDPANYTIILNFTRNTFNNDLYVRDVHPLTLQLPDTFDAYPDIVTMTVKNEHKFPYMKSFNDTRRLVFDPTMMIFAD